MVKTEKKSTTKLSLEKALAFLGSDRVIPLYKYLPPLDRPINEEINMAEGSLRRVLIEMGFCEIGSYDFVSPTLIDEIRPFLKILEESSSKEISKKFRELTGLPFSSERGELAVDKYRLIVVWGDRYFSETKKVWDMPDFQSSKDKPVL